MSGYLASRIRCEICTYAYVAVYPAECDESRLECPSCGYRTSEVLERIKPDQSRRRACEEQP